jgi:hypothetical protein
MDDRKQAVITSKLRSTCNTQEGSTAMCTATIHAAGASMLQRPPPAAPNATATQQHRLIDGHWCLKPVAAYTA